MQVYRFDNVRQFWQTTQDYLCQHEAEHNLLFGILQTLLQEQDPAPNTLYRAIAATNGKILAAAIRTPPYRMILSKARDLKAITLMAQDLHQHQLQLPGIGGLVPEVEAFLQTWQSLTGQSYRRVMAMKIHQLTQVEPVATAKGYLRRATTSDHPLLLTWFTAFAAEIGEVWQDDIEQAVNTGLKRQNIYLWEDDGIAVSWASGSQSLSTMARLGPVYTPKEYRRKGYATACVAALSQKFLAQGCDRCFLFTDSANPTSNHIYQAIGYYPICDWHDFQKNN